MSRALSSAALQAMFASETGEVFVILITIDHDTLDEPVRVCSDAVNLTSRDNVYVAYPFALILPDDSAENAPKATIQIDNVDKTISDALAAITSPPTVTIEIVRAAAPDTVEVSLPEFTLRNVKIDVSSIQGDLTIENFITEPYPAATFTPSGFPGLF